MPALKLRVQVLLEDQSVEEWTVTEPVKLGDWIQDKRTGLKAMVLHVRPL